ncbi:MAG: hypothetical protein HY204_11115 [Nitrospirae bacterium]|nr:hypothetical protein [Nitrospirota bacterium]
MRRRRACSMLVMSLSMIGVVGLTLQGCGSGSHHSGAAPPLVTNDNINGVTYSSICGVNPIAQVSNCPPNDATTLSSKIVFTPSTSGTYYVRVRRSPSAPPSAGVYGGYQIRVTSP